jgi:hypothetical protein
MSDTKRVYSVQTVELQDWNDKDGNPKLIRIHTLVIAKFRKLAEILKDLDPEEYVKRLKEKKARAEENGEEYVEEERTYLDVMLDAVAFCMETFEPALSDPEVLANHADYATLEHILDVAGGVKLNDPNLEAAMAATSGRN